MVKSDREPNRGDVLGSVAYEKKMLEKIPPHENILGYHPTAEPNTIAMDMETYNLQGVSDRIYVLSKTDPDKAKKLAMSIVLGMVKAIRHISKHNIAYNDYKPDNWLLGRDGKIKLMDFGLATHNPNAGLVDVDTLNKYPWHKDAKTGEDVTGMTLFREQHPAVIMVDFLANCGEAMSETEQFKRIEGYLKQMFQAERGFHEGRPEGKSLEERKALLNVVHEHCLMGVHYNCAVDDPTEKRGVGRSPMTCMLPEKVKEVMFDKTVEPEHDPDYKKGRLPSQKQKASPSAQWHQEPHDQK